MKKIKTAEEELAAWLLLIIALSILYLAFRNIRSEVKESHHVRTNQNSSKENQ